MMTNRKCGEENTIIRDYLVLQESVSFAISCMLFLVTLCIHF